MRGCTGRKRPRRGVGGLRGWAGFSGKGPVCPFSIFHKCRRRKKSRGSLESAKNERKGYMGMIKCANNCKSGLVIFRQV